MPFTNSEEFNSLLAGFTSGDDQAATRLFALVYQDLRNLARQYMRHERPDHTLQATALVHEAYLRLFNEEKIVWQNHQHFFVVAARQMRRILVDYARHTHAARRQGDRVKLTLEDLAAMPQLPDGMLIKLDDAMTDLEKIYPRPSQTVELRYFAGLSETETAAILGVSVTTIKRDWELAKAWLLNELAEKNSL